MEKGVAGREKIVETVCDQMRWLIDMYIVDYFVESHWDKLPSSLTEMESCEDADWSSILDEGSRLSTRSYVPPLSIQCLRVLLRQLRSEGSDHLHSFLSSKAQHEKASPKVRYNTRGVKEKKRLEIEHVVPLISHLRLSSPFSSFIDFGAGLGHLTRAIASSIPDLSVKAVEANDTLVRRANELDMARMMEMNGGRVERLCTWVDEHSSDMIMENGREEGLCVGGLHACGDLSTCILRVASIDERVKAVVVFGCCYHRLNGGRDKLFRQEWNENDWDVDCGWKGFPISHRFSHSNLSYCARELACHHNADFIEKMRQGTMCHEHQARRAVAEWIIVMAGGRRHLGLKGGNGKEDIDKYILNALDGHTNERMMVNELMSTNPSLLSSLPSLVQTSIRRIVAVYSLRLLIAPFVEELILLDRAAFLTEHRFTSFIHPLFDPRSSPRRFALIGLRCVLCVVVISTLVFFSPFLSPIARLQNLMAQPTHHVVNLHKLDISFPYSPYECQKAYMDTIIKALDTSSDAALESPTGTGKTLSLLCVVLSWIQRAKTQLMPSFQAAAAISSGSSIPSVFVPRVFYASRTHSQLTQVVRELNKTVYRNLKVCTMGSRDQLCVHESVSKEKDNQTKALKCRNLVKKRGCHYYNQWNAMDVTSLDTVYGGEGKALDIEDLAKVAKKNKHCPFFRSRQQQETADLILLPYNYIIDPHMRQIHKIDLKGSIIIFDEAHNLESVCEESISVSISTSEIAFVIKELKTALEKLLERNETIRTEMDASEMAFGTGMDKENGMKEKEINMDAATNLLECVMLLETKMDELYETGTVTEKLPNQPGKVFHGRCMIEMLEGAAFRKENAVNYSELLHQLAVFLSDQDGENDTRVAIRERGKKLLEFGAFLSKIFADSFEAVSRRGFTDKDVAGENFRLYVVKEGTKITFNYWCLSAGIAMRFLKSRGVHSIIVTSGTLAPLDKFTSNLGIPFSYTLQNEHAAKSTQISIVRVSNGVDGRPLNGAFHNRDSLSYQMGVGEGVVRVADNVPQGVLVFFSSYRLMDACIERWKDRGTAPISIWQRIQRRKEIVVEPRNKAELVQVRFAFDNAIRTRGGAVFLAVARGKVSEGIDFSDASSRAVVIIGIPYPPVQDVRVMLKRNYLSEEHKKNKNLISGEMWYSTEGYRAVNQAIGRVLRHVNDFGVVVLLDSRFTSSTSSFFPKWVQNSFENVNNVAESGEKMKKFFIKRGSQIERSEHEMKNIQTVTKKKTKADYPPSTTEVMQIIDIADEYSSAPVVTVREEVIEKKGAKGILESLASSSSSSSVRIPPKRSSAFSVIGPSLVAIPLSSSNSAKRIKLKANVRLGEEKKEEEEKKKGEEGKTTNVSNTSNYTTAQFKEAVKQCGMKDKLWPWLKEYKEKADAKILVQRLSHALLPLHPHIFKGVSSFVDPNAKLLIEEEARKRGLN